MSMIQATTMQPGRSGPSARALDPNFDRFASEVGRRGVPTHEEHLELFARLRAGDISAREEIAARNLRLTVREARRYVGRGLDFPDLIQAGSLGLLWAVDRFDPGRGLRFSTYAGAGIRGYILKALEAGGSAVRTPHHMHTAIRDARRRRAELARRWGREPSEAEVAESLGLTPARAEMLRRAMAASRPAAGPDQIPEAVAPDEEPGVDDGLDREGPGCPEVRARAVLAGLPDREREVLTLRFGLGGVDRWTLKEVGERLGVTRERVRQIERAALARIRREAGREAEGLPPRPARASSSSSAWGCPRPTGPGSHLSPGERAVLIRLIEEGPGWPAHRIGRRFRELVGRDVSDSVVSRVRALGVAS